MQATPPTSAEHRRLKAAAQHLQPAARVGQPGLTEAVIRSVAGALAVRELVKVRFTAHQPQRHQLAASLATATASQLVTVIGHVAVLYRPRPPREM